MLIFGTESGSIFEGSLNNPVIVHGPEKTEMEWYDPVKIPFSPHFGRVHSVQFSPFDRNIFLSCGSDQQIRIYSLIHPHAPVQVYRLHFDDDMKGQFRRHKATMRFGDVMKM